MYFAPEKYDFKRNQQCFNQFNHSCNNSWRELSNEILYQSSVYISLSNYVNWKVLDTINNSWVMIFFQYLIISLFSILFFYIGKVRVRFLVFSLPNRLEFVYTAPPCPCTPPLPLLPFLPHRGWGFTAPAQLHATYYCIIGHAVKTMFTRLTRSF